jgi:hypothetical protein
MAFHEQHERLCPTCGERISATAPKCYNCGEYVNDNEDEDEEDAEDNRGVGRIVVLSLLGVGLCGGVVYLLMKAGVF